MSSFRIAVAILVATAAQILVAKVSKDVLIRLDLFLILIAAVARRGTPGQAIVTGAVCGGVEDLIADILIGWNGFAKTLIGFLLSTVSGRVLVEHPGAIALSLGSGVLVNALVIGLLRMVLSQEAHGDSPGIVAGRVVVTAAVGVAFALVARYPFRERWREARLRRLRA